MHLGSAADRQHASAALPHSSGSTRSVPSRRERSLCLKGAARLRPVRALGALPLIVRSTSAVPG